MVNKYKEGEFVYAKVNLELELVVRRFVKDIYYCQVKNDLSRKDLVYFERELVSSEDRDNITDL